ncbi:MAG: Uma2 family endonuclease [Planctomycetota bacterium]
MNPVLSLSMEDRLVDLGGIPASRVRMEPVPGTATMEDVTRIRNTEGRLYELVDRTLVEKAMGWQESLLAMVLGHWLQVFLEANDLGLATGADGMTRLFDDTIRGPDVAFVRWDRLPNGRVPEAPIPDLVPNFVIEVLSVSNTRSEMARKRREYFHAGVELAWFVDPRGRTVAVFTSADDYVVYDEVASIDGGEVLPGWTVSLEELFAKLDRRAPG